MKYLKIFISVVAIGTLLLLVVYLITRQVQEPHKIEDFQKDAPGEFVELSTGRVHYKLHGPQNGALVVLIHGGGVAGDHVWTKTIPALTDAGYRVLSYDLYGRGYSDRPNVLYRPELLYTQFEELINTLQIKAPFHLFGQSMGAMMATDFTVNHPDKVKKLVYIAPAALGAFSDKWYFKLPVLSDMLMTFYWYPQSVASQMEEFYNPEDKQEYKKKLDYFKQFKGYKRVNLSTWLNTYTVSLEGSLKEIGKRDTEVLLIMGKEDPLIPVKSKEVYQAAIPTISIAVIEAAGHMPHYEQPDQVNQLIIDFLNPHSISHIQSRQETSE